MTVVHIVGVMHRCGGGSVGTSPQSPGSPSSMLVMRPTIAESAQSQQRPFDPHSSSRLLQVRQFCGAGIRQHEPPGARLVGRFEVGPSLGSAWGWVRTHVSAAAL